jgi:hypothetical protein
MTTQPKSFSDLSLHTLNLSIDLRNIARHRPEAEWEEVLSDIASNTWTIAELIERVDAIHSVLGFIAETPNGYVNREALDGLDERLETVREFLASDEAKQALEDADRAFFEGGPDPKQERERLHKAAPNLLEAAKRTLRQFELILEMDGPPSTPEQLDAEPLSSLRAAIIEAEGGQP